MLSPNPGNTPARLRRRERAGQAGEAGVAIDDVIELRSKRIDGGNPKKGATVNAKTN
jgi:hypothetical protein